MFPLWSVLFTSQLTACDLQYQEATSDPDEELGEEEDYTAELAPEGE